MHASLWVALFILVVVGLYTLVLFMTSPAARGGERTVRWLVYASFIAVCLQATLGGLRVTGQTAGEMNLALALRIFHGCVAQAYLCCVVAAAALLALPRVSDTGGQSRSSGLRRLGWVAIAAIYVQLILGAVMRHLGAGLAIPTFPVASPSGSYLPAEHNVYVDTNFAHTRVGALLVTLIVLFFAHKVLRCAKNAPRLYWPALTLLALVSVQITLGILVILHGKPPTLTTFHVLNGAALLATAVLLTLRLGHSSEALSSAAAPALSTSSQPAAA
jgi:cytochrome c oxidase assembly protein subunit 15